MTPYANKKQFTEELRTALQSSIDIVETQKRLCLLYETLTQEIPCAKPFSISIIPIKEIQYSFFYTPISKEMSLQALSITNTNYQAYLWLESQEWVLNDYDRDVVTISEELSKTPLLNKRPENIRELKYLVDNNFWIFRPEHFPVFSPEKPEDTDEVLSWDNQYVLAGTSASNMEIIKRSDWDALCRRDKDW
ncbi:MAG: hypothetical protein AAGB12_16600 [Pseudomonadota bacterium]